jgi:hypothetical protein
LYNVPGTKYKVPNWKYDGNKVEIDSASLREINRKYDGNRVEIDFAAPACGRRNMVFTPMLNAD